LAANPVSYEPMDALSSPSPCPLTERERDVLALKGRDLLDKEVAARLGISLNTVKRHLASARLKLGVTKTGTALFYAVQAKMVEAPPAMAPITFQY
jgi:DNA-binding CsgD family transcriptional regulator